LFLDDLSVNLPQVPAASGARYRGAEHDFRSKGESAILDVGKQRYRCHRNSQRTVWETARLNGVEFRAQGNEPGWTLEISEHSLYMNGDYGAWQRRFVVPEPVVDDSGGVARYWLDDGSLDVLIRREPCVDSMSGMNFPSQVSVLLDGKSYQGCGRALR